MRNSILIVEKNAKVRNALREWLGAMFPAYHIRDAMSMTEAVSLMRSDASPLILIDDSSVQVDILSALQEIKALFPDVAIVVLVARDYEKYHRDVKMAGANACVSMWKITEHLQSEIGMLLGEDVRPKRLFENL
jgi:DNA-binding NarL/FixJ family response regulator